MSFRNVVVGILALTFGGSAVVGLSLLQRQHRLASGDDSGLVVVAQTAISRGAVIAREHLSTKSFTKKTLPEGALTEIADAVGRTASQSLPKDEPILDRQLGPKN